MSVGPRSDLLVFKNCSTHLLGKSSITERSRRKCGRKVAKCYLTYVCTDSKPFLGHSTVYCKEIMGFVNSIALTLGCHGSVNGHVSHSYLSFSDAFVNLALNMVV